MDKVLDDVKITGITHCRNVIEAVTKIVGKEIGIKDSRIKKKKEPFWKNRILSD